MAITITRSAWIDDDGSGTTGTVINNAIKTDLYNQIDGALAKAAQIAGGNAFTGTQTIAGFVMINATGPVNGAVFSVDSTTGGAAINLRDTTDTPSTAYIYFTGASGTAAGYIQRVGTTNAVQYVTSSDQRLKIDYGLSRDVSVLQNTRIHDFAWDDQTQRRGRGVFAQEAITVLEEAVAQGSDDRTAEGALIKPWGVDYSKYVPDLIVGWQQHEAAIDELRAKLR